MNVVRSLFFSFLIIVFSASFAFAGPKIGFGVPAWPGVTVKTEVAAQILESMGYEAEQIVASPSIILKSIKMGELDAFLGGWTPVEDPMIDPLVAEGSVEKVVANIKTARVGLVVPAKVYEEGITSAEILAAHKDEFEGKIYGIEAGSGINDEIEKVIEADAVGFGDWELVDSSTSAMLAQAGNIMEKGEKVVFVGWQPHWMNIAYDLKYLESETPETAEIAGKVSVVYTIASDEFSSEYPEAYSFLKQFVVPPQVQSDWIYSTKREHKSPQDAASSWIRDNRELVAKWLDGVKAVSGKPALEALYAK